MKKLIISIVLCIVFLVIAITSQLQVRGMKKQIAAWEEAIELRDEHAASLQAELDVCQSLPRGTEAVEEVKEDE